MSTVKLFGFLGVLGVLILAVAFAAPYLQKMQQEHEWILLQNDCAARHTTSCVQLVTQVTPACTRDRDPVACYHLARVISKGATYLRGSDRVASYYQLACQAGVRRACAHPNP